VWDKKSQVFVQMWRARVFAVWKLDIARFWVASWFKIFHLGCVDVLNGGRGLNKYWGCGFKCKKLICIKAVGFDHVDKAA
jgi:hypothetical protein